MRLARIGVKEYHDRLSQISVCHHLFALSRTQTHLAHIVLTYPFFQGFGITIGSDFFFLLDPAAKRKQLAAILAESYTLSGSFDASNSTMGDMQGWAGTFTFTNATTNTNTAVAKGLTCNRLPSDPWWRHELNPFFAFLLVPSFAIFLSLWNLAPIRSRQFPVTIVIACIGWLCNKLANTYIFGRSDIVSFLGAFVVGVLGNLYSRILGCASFMDIYRSTD